MVLASMRSESEPFPINSQARLFAVDYEPDNRLDKGKVAHSQPTCCSSVTLAQTFTHDLRQWPCYREEQVPNDMREVS